MGGHFEDRRVSGNRDQADAAAIYEILEKEVIPLYNSRFSPVFAA